MNITKRFAMKLIVLVAALALGPAGGVLAQGDSRATKSETPSSTNQVLCHYDGKTYSEGSRLTQADGHLYVCVAPGRWDHDPNCQIQHFRSPSSPKR